MKNRDAGLAMGKIYKPCLALLMIACFLAAWYFLAINLTAWSDEVNHLAVGKGLVVSGKPFVWSFDDGRITDWPYTRGLIMSRLAQFAYPYGSDFCLTARVIPLVFTFLTFLFYILYIRKKFGISAGHFLVAAILFFGQSVVLEQSLYVRPYSSLGLFVLVSLMACWQGFENYRRKNLPRAFLLWGLAMAILAVPTIDAWQYQHIPIVLLAVFLGLGAQSSRLKEYTGRHRRALWIAAAAVVIFSPLVAMGGDYMMSKFPIGNRIMGRSFVTFWDNIFGLIRYVWVINICLLGVVLPALHKKRLEWSFHSWLLCVGIVSGFLVGLLNPHNHIFYSRFFYVPIVLTILGFSGILFEMFDRPVVRYRLMALYVALNILMSFANFYYDRDTIRKPIQWLNAHLKDSDTLLIFRPQLELNGGQNLTRRVYPILASQDPRQIKALLDYVNRDSVTDIYLLYTDGYELRNNLYRLTMRENRAPPATLFLYLKDRIPSQSILKGMRGCGLVKYQKEDLIAGLNRLLQEGYPPIFKGMEKRFLKKLLGLPENPPVPTYKNS